MKVLTVKFPANYRVPLWGGEAQTQWPLGVRDRRRQGSAEWSVPLARQCCVLNKGSADMVSSTEYQQPVKLLQAGCGTGQKLCAHMDSSNFKEVILGL